MLPNVVKAELCSESSRSSRTSYPTDYQKWEHANSATYHFVPILLISSNYLQLINLLADDWSYSYKRSNLPKKSKFKDKWRLVLNTSEPQTMLFITKAGLISFIRSSNQWTTIFSSFPSNCMVFNYKLTYNWYGEYSQRLSCKRSHSIFIWFEGPLLWMIFLSYTILTIL